ncbi:MAG: outer membrane lipoprotein chaperone LolA [Granulosicoccaceae bacterium]
MKRTAALIGAALLVGVQAVSAGALQELKDFTSGGKAFYATFVQSVYGAEGELMRESTGEVSLLPPVKFRWDYATPFKQELVSNGETLWLFDDDLQQVTVRSAKEALANSPILLLTGEVSFEDEFEVKEVGVRDGLSWVELKPLDAEADFDAIYAAMDSAGLRVLDMRDKLGQSTQIQFENIQLSNQLNPALFEFKVPDGVDVVEQ